MLKHRPGGVMGNSKVSLNYQPQLTFVNRLGTSATFAGGGRFDVRHNIGTPRFDRGYHYPGRSHGPQRHAQVGRSPPALRHLDAHLPHAVLVPQP